MYKIYYGDKSLSIVPPTEPAITVEYNEIIYYRNEIAPVLEALKANATKHVQLVAKSPEDALNELKKQYRVLPAGGGMVYTPEGYVLIIFRRGKWDLPKGKLDEGEDIADCAVREVEEETGVVAPQLKEKLLTTYHTYTEKNYQVLKESHWYAMYVTEKQTLKPQTDEDIEQCEWVHWDDLQPYIQNMHPSVKDVLDEGLKRIKR